MALTRIWSIWLKSGEVIFKHKSAVIVGIYLGETVRRGSEREKKEIYLIIQSKQPTICLFGRKQNCMHLWATTTPHYINMDNELQALTLLSLLAAVVQINSTFYQATTAYMCRRNDIIPRTGTVPVFSGTISPTLIETILVTGLWFQRNGEKTFTCRPRSP